MNLSKVNQTELSLIESKLRQKQMQLQDQLKLLEESDPVLLSNIIEASESGVESMEADVHIRTLAVKEILSSQIDKIGLALEKIKSGTYGVCGKCGQIIDSDRLKFLPMAQTCKICLS